MPSLRPSNRRRSVAGAFSRPCSTSIVAKFDRIPVRQTDAAMGLGFSDVLGRGGFSAISESGLLYERPRNLAIAPENRVALRGLRGGGRSPTKLVSGAKFPVFGHDQGIISLAAASSGLTNQKKSMIVKALAMSWKRRQANTAEIKQGIGLK